MPDTLVLHEDALADLEEIYDYTQLKAVSASPTPILTVCTRGSRR